MYNVSMVSYKGGGRREYPPPSYIFPPPRDEAT